MADELIAIYRSEPLARDREDEFLILSLENNKENEVDGSTACGLE